MLLKPKILLYIITVAVLIAAVVWEYYMQQWLSYQPNGGANVMRVDLFVIWPVVITLVAISLFKIFRKEDA
ncbi:hypothetical protein [Altibacter lentus]|uniref:hypothetical protein n=1 Tax=Altibacter lentus TaxID=1223410 RepID=UPI00054EE697|nr:hypothetical protein [Altibacter lentus]